MNLVLVANTHTETTVSGTAMTKAYHHPEVLLKKHVNANSDDVLITDGTGMTGKQIPTYSRIKSP
jgi:selenocysteine lyase/cysteine desulfurase